MLSQRYSADQLSSILLKKEKWHPHPTVDDRTAWSALPESVRQAHISLGEEALRYDWPPLRASLFLQYARNGNRTNYQHHHFARRGVVETLVIAECIENQGRFLDQIVDGIWAICEESYWGVPAHVGVQQAGQGLPDTAEPTVDLFAAETAALLAWSHYLLDERLDVVSPLMRPRIQREIDARLLTPCLERDDFWWMGFVDRGDGRRVNNWNSWICSNWLASVLLVEDDEERRLASIGKILRSLDKFIDPYPTDGGCDEGPSYWGRAGASLFDNLDLLYSASNGQINVYDESLIQEIGRFIYRVQIADDYYINFADAPALVKPDPGIVYRYGQQIDDAQLCAFGSWLAQRANMLTEGVKRTTELPVNLMRLLPTLFAIHEMSRASAHPPLPRDVWLPEIQVMVARDKANSTVGLFVAAKGGHNAESHNHNDIGNFVVYRDGKPILVDAGVEEYTAKTFGPQRYEIWTMQSAYHSLLPTIDGVMQEPGEAFAAREVIHTADDVIAQMTLDIGAAYLPESKIKQWTRTITLHRSQNVVISDQFELDEEAQRIELSLLTPCTAQVEDGGTIVLQSAALVDGREAGSGILTFDADQFVVRSETVPIEDRRLQSAWGEKLTRIIFSANLPIRYGAWQWKLQ